MVAPEGWNYISKPLPKDIEDRLTKGWIKIMQTRMKVRAFNYDTQAMVYPGDDCVFCLHGNGIWNIVDAKDHEKQYAIFGRAALMESIGLHGKDGKEIYQGDLLLHRHADGKTLYRADIGTTTLHDVMYHGAILVLMKGNVGDRFIFEGDSTSFDLPPLEIIGNIYEDGALYTKLLATSPAAWQDLLPG